jgi:hypothetical protein
MLNLKKTKIMTTGTLNEFILDGTEMEIIKLLHIFRLYNYPRWLRLQGY